MDKRKLKKLAFLGIAGGLIAASSNSVEAEGPSVDANSQYLLARPACKGANGCGGFTASRDVSENNDDEADMEEGEASEKTTSEARVKEGDDYKNKGVHYDSSPSKTGPTGPGNTKNSKNSSYRNNNSKTST